MMPGDRPPRPASVGVTGWLCVALGGLMVLSAAVLVFVAAMRRALAAGGLDPLAAMEGALDPLSRLLLRNLEALSVLQAVAGIVTLAIGIQFLRLRPGARVALEILVWITLAATVVSGAWGIVAWVGPGNPSPVSSLEGIVTPVAGMVLTLAQCVACVVILRYLRSPQTRALFRRSSTATVLERDGGGRGKGP